MVTPGCAYNREEISEKGKVKATEQEERGGKDGGHRWRTELREGKSCVLLWMGEKWRRLMVGFFFSLPLVGEKSLHAKNERLLAG